jgi:16S rRNA (cytosine967-C5)-methyltransferase
MRPSRKSRPSKSKRHRPAARAIPSGNPLSTGEQLTAALHPELVTALLDVFVGKHRLDKVIERRLRDHREWLTATREHFVETLHAAVREWRLRWNRAGLPDAEHLSRVNFARTRQVLLSAAAVHPREERWSEAVRASVPDWLHARGLEELRTSWVPTIDALNRPAPLFLRTNTLRTDAAALAVALAEEGFSAAPVTGHPEALRVTARRDVFRLRAFREGWFEVQDVHSQRIAPLLGVEPGMRVVDACAGSGGKSLHLAALMRNKGRSIALDTAEWKLAELRRRAARAGVDNLEARVIDDPRALKRLHSTADRVLVDVPCSGLGVLRRNPDTKWKLGPGDLERLRALQAQLLLEYSRLVRPGGKVVYATCSVLPSENERQIDAFLAAQPGWSLEEELRLPPGEHDGDGFYAARLSAPGR